MSFAIRRASERDIPAIVQILGETQWADRPAFDEGHVRGWLEVHPAGLLIAEREGQVLAFLYMQILSFDPDAPFPLRSWAAMTDAGYTRATHTPMGNAYSGVIVRSLLPEAGRALIDSAFETTEGPWLPYIVTTSRITGFSRYLESVVGRGLLPADPTAEQLEQIALFYSRAHARRSGAPVSPLLPLADAHLARRLPLPDEPEPTLSTYLQQGFVLHSVLPGFARDRESADFGLVLYMKLDPSLWMPDLLRAAAPSVLHIARRSSAA